MLLGKRNDLFFSLYVKAGRAARRAEGGGDLVRRREPGSAKGRPHREVHFIIEAHEHVQWPAEGLSSTGAPGQPTHATH